jgi:hypothetical protein
MRPVQLLQSFACQTADQFPWKPICSYLVVMLCHTIERAFAKVCIYLEHKLVSTVLNPSLSHLRSDWRWGLMYQPWANFWINSLSLMSPKPCLNCVKGLLNRIEIWWIGRQVDELGTWIWVRKNPILSQKETYHILQQWCGVFLHHDE